MRQTDRDRQTDTYTYTHTQTLGTQIIPLLSYSSLNVENLVSDIQWALNTAEQMNEHPLL